MALTSYREKSLKVFSSIWFWMGVIGLSVVSYGVFDAVNKQQQVPDIPVATESDQEDPPIVGPIVGPIEK